MKMLKKLSEASGIPGNEDEIRKIIRSELKTKVDSIKTDAMGNIIAMKKGKGKGTRRRVMIAGHMDEIGVARFQPAHHLESLIQVEVGCVWPFPQHTENQDVQISQQRPGGVGDLTTVCQVRHVSPSISLNREAAMPGGDGDEFQRANRKPICGSVDLNLQDSPSPLN